MKYSNFLLASIILGVFLFSGCSKETDKELVSKLPLVFRTLKGQKLTGKQLNKLAERLRIV